MGTRHCSIAQLELEQVDSRWREGSARQRGLGACTEGSRFSTWGVNAGRVPGAQLVPLT